MEIIGFNAEEISGIFELLAAVLNLGNITFRGYALPNGTNACEMQNTEGKVLFLIKYVGDPTSVCQNNNNAMGLNFNYSALL